jgi:hypothetical protein
VLFFNSDARTKFVYFKWVGERISPRQRASALEGSKKMTAYIKIFHCELSLNFKGDYTHRAILDRLSKAAGANYDKVRLCQVFLRIL